MIHNWEWVWAFLFYSLLMQHVESGFSSFLSLIVLYLQQILDCSDDTDLPLFQQVHLTSDCSRASSQSDCQNVRNAPGEQDGFLL